MAAAVLVAAAALVAVAAAQPPPAAAEVAAPPPEQGYTAVQVVLACFSLQVVVVRECPHPYPRLKEPLVAGANGAARKMATMDMAMAMT